MPPKKTAPPGAAAKRQKPAPAAVQEAAPADEWEPTKVQRRAPPDQLRLSEEELDFDANIFLKAKNPNAPHSIARFSFKEHQYKNEPSVDQSSIHLAIDGYLAHVESESGKAQVEANDARHEAERRAEQRRRERIELSGGAAEDEDDDEVDSKSKNQFNFSDRASQTFNNPMRDREIETEPPPTKTFNGSASHSEIFDAYIRRNEEQAARAERKPGGAPAAPAAGGAGGGEGGASGSAAPAAAAPAKAGGAGGSSTALAKAKAATTPSGQVDPTKAAGFFPSLKIVERMVVLNQFEDVAIDFKYYENEADDIHLDEGSLLPLWEFSCDRMRKKHVTCLSWNPTYPDLFAVSYGSYNFSSQSSGGIACFSLKNPSYPEYLFTTESGAMCLHFHPQHSSLIAVGLYDGTVMVFDVRQKAHRPIFQSTIKSGKHTDPVWEVRWQTDDMGKNLSFFSVASDGRVTCWTLSKNELQYSNILELKLVSTAEGGEPDAEQALAGLAGGSCFDFHPFSDHLFLVGTEEGNIHKCSKAYNSQYSATYLGHYMAVYKVAWNLFHRRIFISASADWTVKIWDHEHTRPVMSFDLGNAVNDVAWAPYSSTVFAAVTADGKVHVFDLNQNKNEPMCSQQVVKKAKLTHVVFSKSDPIILVGDDKGRTLSLKLSPNLRRIPVNPEGESKSSEELQIEQVERLLSVAEKGDAIASTVKAE